MSAPGSPPPMLRRASAGAAVATAAASASEVAVPRRASLNLMSHTSRRCGLLVEAAVVSGPGGGTLAPEAPCAQTWDDGGRCGEDVGRPGVLTSAPFRAARNRRPA